MRSSRLFLPIINHRVTVAMQPLTSQPITTKPVVTQPDDSIKLEQVEGLDHKTRFVITPDNNIPGIYFAAIPKQFDTMNSAYASESIVFPYMVQPKGKIRLKHMKLVAYRLYKKNEYAKKFIDAIYQPEKFAHLMTDEEKSKQDDEDAFAHRFEKDLFNCFKKYLDPNILNHVQNDPRLYNFLVEIKEPAYTYRKSFFKMFPQSAYFMLNSHPRINRSEFFAAIDNGSDITKRVAKIIYGGCHKEYENTVIAFLKRTEGAPLSHTMHYLIEPLFEYSPGLSVTPDYIAKLKHFIYSRMATYGKKIKPQTLQNKKSATQDFIAKLKQFTYDNNATDGKSQIYPDEKSEAFHYMAESISRLSNLIPFRNTGWATTVDSELALTILINSKKKTWQEYYEHYQEMIENKEHDLRIQIEDTVKAFAIHVIVPTLIVIGLKDERRILESAKRIAMMFLAENMDLQQLLKLSEWWHKNQLRLNHEINTHLNANEWPKLTEDQVTPSGYHITCLNSAALLAEEGKKMDHCIATYAHKGKSGECHLISIRDQNGEILSSAELFINNNMVECRQHNSKKNSLPSVTAKAALQWYLDQINAGDIVVDHKVLSEYQQDQRSLKGPSMCTIIGFDPVDSDRRQLAFDLYHKAFIKKATIATPEQFIRAARVVERYSKVYPDDAEAQAYCKANAATLTTQQVSPFKQITFFNDKKSDSKEQSMSPVNPFPQNYL